MSPDFGTATVTTRAARGAGARRRLTRGRDVQATRWYRVITIGLVWLIVVELAFGLLPAMQYVSWVGHDHQTYTAAAARWLSGEPFYHPYQLAGPYPIIEREILYPPTILPLLVPFVYLPAVLWWIIPLAIIAWIVWWWRPVAWAWMVIAGLMALPVTPPAPSSWSIDVIANGNPGMWAAAIVALATRWPFFGPFVLLKPAPIHLPFALIGLPARAWWIGAVTLAGISLLFLPLWSDYVTVLLNARGGSALYALVGVPLMLVPVVARLGTQSHDLEARLLLTRRRIADVQRAARGLVHRELDVVGRDQARHR